MSKVRDIRSSDRRFEDIESPSKSDVVQYSDETPWLSSQPHQTNIEAASLVFDDNTSASDTSSVVGVSDPLQPLDFLVEGHVYHWSSGTLLQNVSYKITDPLSPETPIAEGFTDAFGGFSVQFPHEGNYTLTATLEATAADTKRIITSADALAALKLAVNLNPNPDPDGAGGLDAPPPSPYQYIAADVNGDGRVTSADALAILKIAVNLSDALKASWVFVPESDGYWDVSGEFAGPHGLSRSNVTWSKGGITTDATYNTSANLVAVLLGDVNGSWSSSNSDPNYLPDDYYELLKDPSPVFISDPQGLSVDENTEFVEIYTAQAIDEGANAGPVVYSLDERGLEYFDIDSSTGVISVIVPPDYETDSVIQFNVIATDQGGNQTAQGVSVVVNNLDEVAPTITSGDTATAIDENSGANQTVYTAIATDDGDVSGGVTFSLKAGSDEGLSIDADSGAVTLSTDPDAETKDSYSFTVVATDAAGNASEQAVTLSINNLDEVAPTITSGDTATAIDENSGANQTVYTAAASDDGDLSGGVTFSLKAGSDEGLSIDADSGAVTLSTDPDAETKDSYSFTVVATDAAGNASEQAVTLSINNLDEVAPTITSAATATAIDENSGANQTVYTAIATDDGDVSGGVTFSLKAGSDEGLSIDADSGAVTLSTDPDAETKDSYSFTVVATDAAGNASEQAVTLSINNLDEVAPTITSAATATAIDENSGANQTVYTATASDDGDISGGVTFSLKAGSDEGLSIDADSGAVTLSTDPDAETKDSYSFTVVATDAAGNASEQAVTLSINNLDEVAPTITSGDTATAIDENSGANQTVYTATASDDGDISGGVTFSLKAGSDEGLSIDADTGAVTLLADPDFELVESYQFTVVAADTAGNSAEQSVTLAVNDLDDTGPTFTSEAVVQPISENATAGVFYTAVAQDEGGVSYGLVNDFEGLFSIDAQTGALSNTSSFDFEAAESYSLTVYADDAQGNRSQLALSVEVVNEDDTAPVFTSAAESVAFAGSTLVYQGIADDSADVTDGNLTYSLRQGGDSALLSIDAVSGQVSLASGVVPTDVSASYSFTIEVSDGVNEAVSQSVTVSSSQVLTARGPGVLSQGGLLVTSTFTDVVTLSVFVDPSAYGALQGGVSSIDFTLAYDIDAFEALVDSAVVSPVLDFYTTNTEEVGYLEFAGFESPTNVISVDSLDPLVTIELTPKGTDVSAVSLVLPLVNDIGFADTEFLAGAPVQISGTEAPESFVLAGGDVSITSGAGADLFIITDATGSETTIDDFETGVDKIDMSLLLLGLGYQSVDSDANTDSVDGVVTRYSDTSATVLDLIAANDLSLDNVFGLVIEGDDGVIQGFYDADSNADSVDIKTFEITIGEAESSLTADDLQVAIGGFIA